MAKTAEELFQMLQELELETTTPEREAEAGERKAYRPKKTVKRRSSRNLFPRGRRSRERKRSPLSIFYGLWNSKKH